MPAVRVQLLTTVRIPPCHSTVVAVQTGQGRKLLLLEPTPNSKSQALLEDAALVETGPGGMVNIMLTNKEGHTVKVHQRALIATATVAKIVEPATILEGDQSTPVAPVRAVKNAKAARVEKLFALLPKEEAMQPHIRSTAEALLLPCSTPPSLCTGGGRKGRD